MLMILIIIAVVVIMGIVTFIALHSSQKKLDETKTQASISSTTNTSTKKNNGAVETLGKLLGMIGINGLNGGAQEDSVQDFIPLDDIRDSVICVHSQTGVPYYRMLVECSSINYDLKSDEEQAEVDAIFQSAITSWQFPWGIYVQTRRLDNRDFVQQTIDDVAQTVQLYPQLATYGQAYTQFLMQSLKSDANNLIIKKKYIVVACNNAFEQVDLDDNDKFDWARSKLRTNCSLVMNYMRRLGIAAHICTSTELMEVMFEALNKEEGAMVDALKEGDFTIGSVGSFEKAVIPPEDLQRIIHEFANRLDACIIEHPDADEETRKKAIELRKEAVEMSNRVSPKHEETLLERLNG